MNNEQTTAPENTTESSTNALKDVKLLNVDLQNLACPYARQKQAADFLIQRLRAYAEALVSKEKLPVLGMSLVVTVDRYYTGSSHDIFQEEGETPELTKGKKIEHMIFAGVELAREAQDLKKQVGSLY